MSTNRQSRANELRYITHNGRILPSFTCGYIAAMLWIGITDEDGRESHNIDDMPSVFRVANIADSTMERIIGDCDSFLAHRALWDGKESDWTVGTEFFLTRNRHGSGFWDSPDVWGEEEADRLTTLAHDMGEFCIFFDNGGRIYGC